MGKEIKRFGFDTECEFRSTTFPSNGISQIGSYTDSIFELEKETSKWNNYATSIICYITASPTSNCQLYSIGYFQGVLQYKNWYEILCYIQHNIGKNILLLDINVAYCHTIESKISKEDIISKTKYTSTNRSNMCIYLIKTVNISKDAYNYSKQPNWENCNYNNCKAQYKKKKLLEKSNKLNNIIKDIKEKDNTINKIYNDLIEVSDEKN